MPEFTNYMPLREMVKKKTLPFTFQFLHNFDKMKAISFDKKEKVLAFKTPGGQNLEHTLSYSREDICIFIS